LGEKFIVKIDERGRILIPKKIRRELTLRKGDFLALEVSGDTLILKPLHEVKKVRARELEEVFFDAGRATFGD